MKKFLYIAMAAALVFNACKKEEAPVANSSISLSTNVIEADAAGNVYEIKVTSGSDWRVSGFCEWARPLSETGKSGDVLKIEVDPNESYDVLITEFKVFSGSAVETVSVVSKTAGNQFRLVSPDEVTCSVHGGTLSLSLISSVADEIKYEFSEGGSEWLSYKETTEFLGKTILIFNVVENTTYFGRDTEVRLTCGDAEPLTVAVHQSPVEHYEFSENSLVFEGLCAGTLTSEIYSNVDFKLSSSADWLSIDVRKGDMREDGLYVYTVTYSFGEAKGSRSANIQLDVRGEYGAPFSFLQKDPDAVLVEITDRYLRDILAGNGWILSYGEYDTHCEVLEKGLTATRLAISYEYSLQTIDGLGNFPELNEVSLRSLNSIKTLDLSDCHKISTLTTNGCNALETVMLGDNPLTTFELDNNTYLKSESLVISSDNLTAINVNSIDSWYIDYDRCETLDVSGCPKLSELKARREGEDYWSGSMFQPLKTILVSQAQKDAIDAGTLTVDKSDITEIVVK